MSIATIDEMIEQLEIAKKSHGGDAPLFIHDADTGWHMPVSKIRKSNSEPGRVLLVPVDYCEVV